MYFSRLPGLVSPNILGLKLLAALFVLNGTCFLHIVPAFPEMTIYTSFLWVGAARGLTCGGKCLRLPNVLTSAFRSCVFVLLFMERERPKRVTWKGTSSDSLYFVKEQQKLIQLPFVNKNIAWWRNSFLQTSES